LIITDGTFRLSRRKAEKRLTAQSHPRMKLNEFLVSGRTAGGVSVQK
jgi:hypothetical protein